MSLFLVVLHGLAALGALGSLALLLLRPSAGTRSRKLGLYFALVGTGAGAGAIWAGGVAPHSALRLALACLALSESALTLALPDICGHAPSSRRRQISGVIALGLFGVAIAWPFLSKGTVGGEGAIKFLDLGAWGQPLGMLLLASGVLRLATIEQAYRQMEEHLRWARKHLMLAMALVALPTLVLATRCLLYHTFETFDLGLWSSAQIFAAALFVPGWRRARSAGALRLSQSAIIGSFTIIAIGIYLVLAAILAGWLGSLDGTPTELAAFLFLLALSFLAAALVSAEVRHKARTWVRRNLYEGRYDYRALWLQAEDAIPATRDPAGIADAFVALIGRTVSALEVTLWTPDPSKSQLVLAGVRGGMDADLPSECRCVRAILDSGTREVRCESVENAPAELADMLSAAKAELWLPLYAGGEFVGLLTVGSDRTGMAHDDETWECLRVIARHASRELLQVQLLEGQLRAREAEAFTDFAHGVMHDLKNFASTLNLVAQNARKHGDNPEFLRDAFESVIDTAEKMRRLCNSLRHFSPDAISEATRVDLSALVREVAGESGSVELDLAEVPEVLIDRDSIASAIRNLVVNAREAAGDEGTVKVSTWADNGSVLAAVVDDGPGIADELLEGGLFQPFRTTKSDGLGLGLFQTRRQIEASGGAIRLVSGAGEGARFELQFPAARGDSVTEQDA